MPKREKGIDPGCGARRHERGDDRNQGKNRRRAAHHQRVVPLETEEHLIQHGARQACGAEGQRNPYGDTDRNQHERLSYDHIDHGRTSGAKRHAQADLRRALRHRVRHRAVQTDGREDHRNHCE